MKTVSVNTPDVTLQSRKNFSMAIITFPSQSDAAAVSEILFSLFLRHANSVICDTEESKIEFRALDPNIC